MTVAVSDKFIDAHHDFRLIIVTRDGSINLTPCERTLVYVVNFVTKTTLKALLLTLLQQNSQSQKRRTRRDSMKVNIS